jgi:hypothetical protein
MSLSYGSFGIILLTGGQAALLRNGKKPENGGLMELDNTLGV